MTREIPANAENRYQVTARDLPLRCPMPGMTCWNSHPRVFLPIDETGEENAPTAGQYRAGARGDETAA